MRADERGAFEEFFARFAPLLRDEAVRRRIQPALREEAVVDCLEETAMSLIRQGSTTPSTLAGYLVVSFRRKHLNRLRAEKRREANERALVEEIASAEPTADRRSLEDPTLLELGAGLLDGLDPEERQLARWMGEQVPLREVADWLGISHGAARQRATRLRNKLRRMLEPANPAEAADD